MKLWSVAHGGDKEDDSLPDDQVGAEVKCLDSCGMIQKDHLCIGWDGCIPIEKVDCKLLKG